MLSQSISCRSHAGLGDMGDPQSPKGSCPFVSRRNFTQHCHRHHKRRNFLDGLSRLTFLQQAVTFCLLKQAATSSSLCAENKVPARQGRVWLNAPSSCFGKAILQHSYVCWCIGFGVGFNDQNEAYVPQDWLCVLSLVPPPAAPCQEGVEVEEDAGELTL